MLKRNTEGKDGENEKRSNVGRENGWGYSRIDGRLGCSYLEVQEEHNSVTEPNLGPLAPNAAKLTYWHWVVVKENTAFIVRSQRRSLSQLMLKMPKLPSGFQAFLKVRWGRGIAWYVFSLCTVLWLMVSNRAVSQGLTLSVLRLQ